MSVTRLLQLGHYHDSDVVMVPAAAAGTFYHGARREAPPQVALEGFGPYELDAVADSADERHEVTHRLRRAVGNLARMFNAGEGMARKKLDRQPHTLHGIHIIQPPVG